MCFRENNNGESKRAYTVMDTQQKRDPAFTASEKIQKIETRKQDGQ